MSSRCSTSCHVSLIVPRKRRRMLSLPCQQEKPGNLQVFPENLSPCKNGPRSRRSCFTSTDRRRDAYQSRRAFFDKAHLGPSVCAMGYFLSPCRRHCIHKRSLDFREHGYDLTQKGHKPSNLNCDMASTKSTRSKAMVSHKYRTVDSLQRSGTSHAEKPKDTELSEIKSRRSSKSNKSDGFMTPEINGMRSTPPLVSDRKGSLISHEDLPEDWTQEHLLEPRKTEKRKSLDELQAKDSASHVTWRKKARRRLRKVENSTDAMLGTAGVPDYMEPNAGPAEELQRSLSSSEGLGLDDVCDRDRNEKISTSPPSDQQDVTANDKRVLSTSQFSKQQNTDFLKGLQDEASPSQPLAETSGLCSPAAVKNSQSIGNELSGKGANEGRAASNYEKLSCSSLVYLDAIKPQCGEGETLPKQKETLESLCACDDEKEDTVGEIRLNTFEGRKCGLCGGDSRGEPAKYLLPVSIKRRDGQTSKPDGLSPRYSEWDAFGNEPGWLGPLLGPLGDHFGIAGVWVHQECAIWSPEVYFAAVGHIKNIRAALRRGKFLKCTRCARPGATIGCRIERCPRTYHLPCARFEGCYFDHKKFLMACDEHLHHFLPHLPGHRHRRNSLNMGRIRFKRKVSEWKKTAQRAAHFDAEAEEKWQEKAGVDEEFLRREHKRFHRDIARVAPVMVGGNNEEYRSDGWESIAGSDNVIRCLKEMVILPLLYPEALERLGVSPPRGVLLHGHPGTGKTLAVKALVGACAKGHKQIAYFARKGADCLGKYAGDAERQLRMLFYLAEKHQPSIIFFDEIDGLAPTRSQHQDQTQKSVVSTLLALMDGIKSRGSVIVIGATNRPDALDPALRRPGRFDREVYFPLPSLHARTAILSLLTKNWQTPQKQDIISLLASKTTGFAGADLQALCAQAALNSLRRTVSVNDLLKFVENKGNIASFPDLGVSTEDWATALGQVSPPCSCRSAKAALNRVICAPVPRHILPVLLWPMVELLLPLHIDKRAILPPVLSNLATLLDKTLTSNLGDFWIDQISTLLHDSSFNSLKRELEGSLEDVFSMVGMISDQKFAPATPIVPNVVYEGSKFHIMLSGEDRAWLDHFAAWLLFGFEGFVEMCNLNLTTMLQEGGGDVVQGLIHVLGSLQTKTPCVVYMSEMESWAVESVAADPCLEKGEVEKRASHYWNVFMQQVNLLPSRLQITFVASSQMRKDHFPHEIVEFFWGTSLSMSLSNDNTSGGSLLHGRWLSCNRSIPCSWIEASCVLDIKKVFSRAADGLAGLLCQEMLYHCQSANETSKLEPLSSVEVVFAEKQEVSGPLRSSRNEAIGHATGRSIDALSPVACLNETGLDAAWKPDTRLASSMGAKSVSAPGNQPCSLYASHQNHLSIAISMVGYELLYHPDLRELRYATSKLLEGPLFTITSYTKRTSPESSDSSSSRSDHPDTLSIKGLNAVGLLAYTGKYSKARDLAWGVQEVVNLMMKHIDMKVEHGKDREQFSHLFHQAASLQDKIFLWSYNLRRFDLAPNRALGMPVEVSAVKSEAGEEHDTPAANMSSETKEVEGLPSLLVQSSSMMASLGEALHGMELNAKVLLGEKTRGYVSYGTNKAISLHTKTSEQDLQFNALTTDKLYEVKEEQHILKDKKCCPSCLEQVKRALRKFIVKSWRSRRSELFLNVVDEVIGRCTSAVFMELNRVLDSSPHGFAYAATSSCRNGCVCGAFDRSGKETIMLPALKNKRSNSGLLTSVELDQNLTTMSYMCLCPLVKLIRQLKS